MKYEALLKDFLNGPRELEKEVEGIEKDLADYRPFEGAWTIREHVVHVTDSDIITSSDGSRFSLNPVPTPT